MKKITAALFVSLIICVLFVSCTEDSNSDSKFNADAKASAGTIKRTSSASSIETAPSQTSTTKENKPDSTKSEKTSQISKKESKSSDETIKYKDKLEVHFLDVGQADCIYIRLNEIDILVDSGNNSDSGFIINYLKNRVSGEIELVIATHPHEDHIGSMDDVINTFKIKKILKPGLSDITTNTSKDFELAIAQNNVETEWSEQETLYTFGNLKLFILSDKKGLYENTNNFSIVFRLDYGQRSFLFTGDAEAEVEHDILNSNLNIKADVLKQPHHGSLSSGTIAYLHRVKPEYTVISVGDQNRYGHPDPQMIKRLNNLNIEILRTDLDGTIIFSTDGSDLSFVKNKISDKNPSPTPGQTSAPTSSPIPTNTPVPVKSSPSPEPTSSPVPTEPENNKYIEITALDKEVEYVRIKNFTENDVDLTGWYIISVRGNQRYNFPDGYILKANTEIKIASHDEEGDLKWTTGYIWNNKEKDDAELYNDENEIIYKWND
jgi:competence protein ComEC